MKARVRRLRAAAFCALSVSFGPAPASADDEACRSAYVETQRLQRIARFVAARRQAVLCGQDSCSESVRSQCATWLEGIERALPTLVIDARDGAGAAIAEVRVEANGELLAERLNGRALELDPGECVLSFRHAGQVVQQRTVIRESEKYRMLEVRFNASTGLGAGPPPQPLPAAPSRLAPTVAPDGLVANSDAARDDDTVATIPVASYVLGGLGLAGLTTFAVLASGGYASERHLRSTCEGACAADQVDAVRIRYLVADTALGVGIGSLGVAVGIWLWAPSAPRAARGLSFGPRRVAFEGEF